MRIYSVYFCLFCAVFVFGQSDSAERQIWNKLQTKLSSEQGIQGSFRLTKRSERIHKVFVSEGEFSISEKNGIIWETLKPIKDRAEFSMEKLRTYFSGNFDELNERFSLMLEKGSGTDILKIIPKEKEISKVISSVKMTIKGEYLQNCLIVWANGSSALYEFMVP